ncbi:hypothetical protein ACFLYN_02595 [Chloroflexota bacterium]
MDWTEILKWVGLVLAAGFVGYFGRYLAMWIIDKMRRKKIPSTTPSAPEPPASPEVQLEETRNKLEKKRSKTEAKKAKKAGKK